MVEESSCQVCGKATKRTLLKDAEMKIFVCSRKCEREYVETLQRKDKARQEIVHYLNKKIAKIKMYQRCCWAIALSGIVMMLVSVFLANSPVTQEQLIGPYLFLVGVAPITCSMMFISQLYKDEVKLIEKRDEIALAYSY